MKPYRTKPHHVHALIASIAIFFLLIPNCYSSIHEATPIVIEGKWDTNSNEDLIGRSLPTVPITAFLLDSYINIQNEKSDCDITINIINCTTGDIVYQQTVSEAATSNMLIPTNNLISGEYILELTGPGAKHLEGYFSK